MRGPGARGRHRRPAAAAALDFLLGPLGLACGLLVLGCASSAEEPPGPGDPLDLAESVDLERYQGLWYEIARLPNRFQEQCRGDVTAEYELRDDGRVDVVNRCRTGDGDLDSAEGVARRPDPGRPAALEVRFAPAWLSWLPAVWGEYQVMALDDEYRWSLVGSPSRKYLWILAREPEMDQERYRSLVAEARRQGFPVGRLQLTPHETP